MKPVPTCHHILPDGRICRSAALRGELFCYYHQRDRQRTRVLRRRVRKQQLAQNPDADIATIAALNLPTPDNPIATQICIATILQAMMTGALSGPLGGRLLYGLHLAKCNYRDVALYNHENSIDPAPESIAVAATDPEPIPLDPATAESSDDIELADYAKALEIEEIPIELATESDDRRDCAIDYHYEKLAELIGWSKKEQQDLRESLNHGYREIRENSRSRVLNHVTAKLERRDAIDRVSQDAMNRLSTTADSSLRSE